MQTKNLKIGIIGAGNIGSGIVRGLIKGNLIKNENIYISDVSSRHLESIKQLAPEIKTSTSNVDIVKNADILIMAVKPMLVELVLGEIRTHLLDAEKILISIAAGIEIEKLIAYLGTKNQTVFRVIPNTAIEILQSVTAVSSYNASEEQENLVREIFSELGKVFFIGESQMSAFTALASCGIAYAFRYIRAAVEGGVEIGFHPREAQEIVTYTVKGAVDLLLENKSHPEMEIDKVTSPGGLTIKGLNEMELSGFSSSVISGLKASK